jgi:hypothetical protein
MSLWRNLVHRDRVERDLDDELRATFGLLVDEHVEAGMPPDEARRAAGRQLGSLESVKDQVRDVCARSYRMSIGTRRRRSFARARDDRPAEGRPEIPAELEIRRHRAGGRGDVKRNRFRQAGSGNRAGAR